MKHHHLLTLAMVLFSQICLASYVDKVKGKKALIVLDGMSVKPGDNLEVIDSSTNKKTAILKVTKVKNNKAIAEVIRGKAKIRQEVRAKAETSARRKVPKTSKKKNADSTFAVGALLGLGFDTMKLSLRDSGGTLIESITQTGIGFSLMGAADMWLNSWFSVRGLAGIEQFNSEADSTQGASPCSTCETKITYFNAMAWGRIHLLENIWFGPGLGLQQPISVTTNTIDESTVGTAVAYGFGVGADIAMGDSVYLPLQVEYGQQNKSPDVETSYYSVRLGLMLRY